MSVDELIAEIAAYDARVAEIRAEGGNVPWDRLNERFEQNTGGISIKKARNQVGEQQRAAQYGGPDDERVDDFGGRARQFAQGLTLGFGDEIAGIIGAIGPGTYKEAQQRSLAGVEEFRRKNPWEAMALEGAGSMVLPGAGSIGAARSGVGILRGLGAASKTKRALAHGGLGLVEGAVYGAGEAGPGERLSGAAKMGSVTGGLGGLLGASPLGRMGQQAIRRRGNILKDEPGAILRRVPDVDVPIGRKTPEGVRPTVNLQRKARELFESRVSGGAEGPVTAQTLATHTPRSANILSRETAEATTDFGGEPIKPALLQKMRGMQPVDPTLPLPSTGPGRRIGTEQLSNLSGLIQRGTRQRGLLSAGLDVDRARMYSPLERVYGGTAGKSWTLTDDVADRAAAFGGDALDDVTYRVDLQEGRDLLLKVMDQLDKGARGLARGGGRPSRDVGFISEMRKSLNLEERAKLKKDITKKNSEIRANSGLAAHPVAKKKATAELAALEDKLKKMETVEDGATLPGMKAMQRFRRSVKDQVERNNNARNVILDIENAMRKMFPGLESADEVFKVSKTKYDLFRAGLTEADEIQFQKLVDTAESAGLGQPNAARNLDNLIEQARALAPADNPALKNEYVNQFLDGHFQSQLIEPLLSGKKAGAKRAEEVYDQINSPAGREWLRRFFPSGDEGTAAFKKALSDIDHDLPLEVTMPRLAENMRWGRRLVAGALGYQFLKSTGVIGGGGGGGPDSFSR